MHFLWLEIYALSSTRRVCYTEQVLIETEITAQMAKIIGVLVLLVLLVLGVKIALAGFAFATATASFMAKAGSVAILAIFGIGVFTVTRFAFKKR